MSRAQLALGSVQFGLAYGIAGRAAPVPDEEVAAILARAAESGVSVIDTAPGYGDIEPKLNRLAGGADFRFVSKIPAIPSGLSARDVREFVKQSAASSLERLGPRLGSLLFHRGADLLDAHGEEAWEGALQAACETGVSLGVSCYSPEEIAAIRARFPVTVAQVPGNAFDQRLRSATGLEGVEIHLRSAFLQGLLLMPPDDAAGKVPSAAPALAQWDRWCRARGSSKLQASLDVVKSLPGVRFCVVGVDALAQFEEVAAAWDRATPVDAGQLAVADADVIDPRRWPRQ